MMVCENATTTTTTTRMVNTRLDHVEGMLDRDQRTVRTRSMHQVNNNTSNHIHGYPTTMTTSSSAAMGSSSSSTLTTIPSTTFELLTTTTTSTEHLSTRTNFGNTHSNSWRTRKSRTMWKIMPKLKKALVLSVYLLSVFYIPRTSCAPMRNMEERMNSHPKWINPCGMSNDAMDHGGEGVSVEKKELLSHIELQAQIAFDVAKNFRDEYVQKTFQTEFNQYHQTWKENHYDWLPTKEQIPKDLSEETPSDHLQALELNKSLLDTYEYLQMVAVGLEQIVWDQEDQEEEDFIRKFKETEENLRSLLCEIQMAIIELKLDMRPDVRRDIMTDPYRNMSNTTSRYFRDWVIFRDYMNALEYVVDVFRHLEQNL